MSARVIHLASLFLSAALIALLGAGLAAAPVHAQESEKPGTIAGVVVDAETGESLPGANVVIAGTQTGSQTDLDGRFEIKNLDPGTYDVRFSYVGYQAKTVQGVELAGGETERLEVSLASDTAELEEVVVTADAARNSEAGLLRERQKAAAVSDAISAETISRSGSSTAADAIEKIPGAAVVNGKFANVRGLSGRYLNTQLNGTSLPSTDADRNAVPLDLFPSDLLKNVVASKTFTPDKPGDFTGASLNINTETFPTQRTLTFSTSISVSSEVGLGTEIPRSLGGLDEVPDVVQGGVPNVTRAAGSEELAQQLDAVTRAFGNNMIPVARTAPVDQSYGLSFGNQYELGGMPLGVLLSGTFDQSVSGYDGGVSRGYLQVGQNSTTLPTQYSLSDETGSREQLYGGLANLSIKPHPNHELGLNALYNRSQESFARVQTGSRDNLPGATFRTRVLHETERSLLSLQSRGEHLFGSSVFGSNRGLRASWNAAYGYATQEEPDQRLFADDFSNGGNNPYDISLDSYSAPFRLFRDLDETTMSSELNLEVPLSSATVKLGGSYLYGDRTFRERRFEYTNLTSQRVRYQGEPSTYFGEEAGLAGREGLRYVFGPVIRDATQGSNNYDGERTIGAGYAMIDTPVPGLRSLRVIGGARVEHTDLWVVNQTGQRGEILSTDVLPSLNLVYSLTDNMNARLAYGRTLARPSFREFAPFATTDFIGGQITNGNPNLNRTTVNNFDARWEWFPRPGEILAVSGFYKDFTDPIERTYDTRGGEEAQIQYQNLGNAQVFGLELEARKRLDFVAEMLQYFQLGGNLTLTHSEVDVGSRLLNRKRAFNPDYSATRPLEGQSPYLLNADLSYENPESGTTVSLFYNVFGERLFAIVVNSAPDLYEQPRHTIDFVASQRMPFGLKAKFSAKNLLGEEYRVVQTFKGEAFVNEMHPLGRSFSLGLEYDLR